MLVTRVPSSGIAKKSNCFSCKTDGGKFNKRIYSESFKVGKKVFGKWRMFFVLAKLIWELLLLRGRRLLFSPQKSSSSNLCDDLQKKKLMGN